MSQISTKDAFLRKIPNSGFPIFFLEIGKWIVELKIAHSDLHFISIYLGLMNHAFYVV